MGREMGKGMAADGAMLFGRRTYADFAASWPHRTDGNPFTPVLNAKQKYVVSTTLPEQLPWQNSALLPGDGAEAVARLKEETGPGLTVLGGGELVGSLAAAGLVDDYVLMIHPLVLGSGRRFPDGAAHPLRLVDSVQTSTGVIIARYVAA